MRQGPTDKSAIETTNRSVRVDEAIRRSLSVDVPADRDAEIVSYFQSLKPALESRFDVTLSAVEPPHYLIYKPGAFFAPHRDRPGAENPELSNRKVSVVLFLNTGFEGGALTFYGMIDGKDWQDKGFACEPAPGLVIAFRSDTLHEVTPVTSGERFTIVSWFA